MNQNDFKKHVEDFTDQILSTLNRKGQDYAKETDALSNFKVGGKIANTTPEKQCLSLIATKVARLSNLLVSETEPNNESVSDSLLDLSCYCVLLDALIKEKEEIRYVACCKTPDVMKNIINDAQANLINEFWYGRKVPKGYTWKEYVSSCTEPIPIM